MRRFIGALGAAAILVIAATGHAQMPPAAVVVDEAKLRTLSPTVDVPGTVISRYDARLATELSARLVSVAEVGTVVETGDPVARLEDATFRVALREAESRVARAEAEVRFLRSERERLERLSENNLSARSQLDRTSSELAMAESDVAIAEAQLDQARIAMHMTQIRAPFDGIVTERFRSIGERLNVADEVVRLVDPDSLEVVARAPLGTVNFIATGEVLALHNDFRSGEASVRTIVPFGNPQSHMFEVRLDADPALWTVGESVRVAMPTAAPREALTVSRDALVLRREGTSVFKVRADETVEKVNVLTGMGSGSYIEIMGNVEPGDRIVVRGAERLDTGMPVNVREGADPGTGAAANR